jgi:hypothetical protein
MLSTLFTNLREYTIADQGVDFTEEIIPFARISELRENESELFFSSFQELLNFDDSASFAKMSNVIKPGLRVQQKNRTITCNPSKTYPCGAVCRNQDKPCKNPIEGQAKTYAEFLELQAKKKSEISVNKVDKTQNAFGNLPRLTPENLEALDKLGTIITFDDSLPSNETQIGVRLSSASRLLKDKRVDLLDRELGSEDIIDQHKINTKEIEEKYPTLNFKKQVQDLALDLIKFAKENDPKALVKHKGHIHRFYKDIKSPTPVQTAIYEAINDIKNKK